jgi:hypothetical protein
MICPVSLSERNEIHAIKSCKHGFYRVFSFHLTPRAAAAGEPEASKDERFGRAKHGWN